ncbi:MATE family efflux transporter [Romboutsia weinsteinii]|uniref:Multidrug export protein MepA n=1 Tax=Romboutsia weinsteinii TaxID=2020949 RepID=A0A371J9R8_9FIRM|nr:MATE family efflux transporter [Romboutsia weinsteinii]RDY29408.1 MATE family efflux transporter [Romboutsia weinsteinii]
MNNTQEMLANEPVGKLLMKYSIPAIIGMMVNALYNVVDRIFIGNIPDVGPLAITGVGVTLPIMTILLAFAMLVGIGATTNISIKLGQGKRNDAEKIIGNTITLSVIVGATLTIIGIVFGNNILSLFGASEGSMYYAKAYINIILVGAVFNILAFALNSTIRGDGSPKIAAMIMVVGCSTNIVLDAVLIFVFKMGIQGAAVATVISQAVTAIWALSYYLRGKSNLAFKKENLKLDASIIKTIFAIGCAPFSMQIAASLVQVISNNSLKAYGGDLAIGSMATIMSIMMIFLMPLFGINQGAQPIIGFSYGAKRYDRAKKAFMMSLAAGTVVLLIGALVIQLCPQVVVRLFNPDQELMGITINGIKKYGLMLPIVPISILGSNYIQSVGKAKEAMLLSLLRQVILLVPMILILPKFMGLDGVWYAQPVSDFIAVIITALILVKEFKSYKKIQDEAEYVEAYM